MNAWERQQSLARTTTVWALASVAVGGASATRRDGWWRAFGQQNLGWGAANLVIVGVLEVVRSRRRSRLPNPDAPTVLEREQRLLRKALWVNVAADTGYVLGGVVLWCQPRDTASGAGLAIAVQGAFLLLHDGYHALECNRSGSSG
jgi:hypothetical protein